LLQVCIFQISNEKNETLRKRESTKTEKNKVEEEFMAEERGERMGDSAKTAINHLWRKYKQIGAEFLFSLSALSLPSSRSYRLFLPHHIGFKFFCFQLFFCSLSLKTFSFFNR